MTYMCSVVGTYSCAVDAEQTVRALKRVGCAGATVCEMCGGEIEPKEWPCSYAGGSLSVTPIFGDGGCPSDWNDAVQ